MIAERIPARSYELAFWLDSPPGYIDTGEAIDTVCNVHHLSQHDCRITKAMGKLTEDVLVAIARFCHSKGYKFMSFEVTKGHKASHWADYQKTVGGMDYYTVDLHRQLTDYDGVGNGSYVPKQHRVTTN
jgi:hypothetical protein